MSWRDAFDAPSHFGLSDALLFERDYGVIYVIVVECCDLFGVVRLGWSNHSAILPQRARAFSLSRALYLDVQNHVGFRVPGGYGEAIDALREVLGHFAEAHFRSGNVTCCDQLAA